MSETYLGSPFDDALREDGLLEEAEAIAVKRVLAWQLREAMTRENITKQALAERMQTSRSQVDRLLSPRHAGVQMDTLIRAARQLNLRLTVSLEPLAPRV